MFSHQDTRRTLYSPRRRTGLTTSRYSSGLSARDEPTCIPFPATRGRSALCFRNTVSFSKCLRVFVEGLSPSVMDTHLGHAIYTQAELQAEGEPRAGWMELGQLAKRKGWDPQRGPAPRESAAPRLFPARVTRALKEETPTLNWLDEITFYTSYRIHNNWNGDHVPPVH